MDWAMEWLPHFYREKMEQWFAKGGVPWHEAVVFKRVESGEVKKYTFTHVAQESEQTAVQVFFIISDVLKQVKDIFPGVNRVTFQSDNAGCYHTSILLCSLLFSKLKLQVKR